MTTEVVCFHCAWAKKYHALDKNELNEEDAKKSYLPLTGALFSLLDCPGYEPDLTGEVLREKSLRAAFEARLSEQW